MAAIDKNAREGMPSTPEQPGVAHLGVSTGSAAQHASTSDVGHVPLSHRLIAVRWQGGWSLRDVAAATGVPLNTLSRIERGYRCRSDHYQAVERWLSECPPTPAADGSTRSPGIPAAPSAPDAGTFAQWWAGHRYNDALPIVRQIAEEAWEAARRQHTAEVAELRAEVREWLCAGCRTVYPGPPLAGARCIICPRCGGDTGPRTWVERREEQRQHTAALAERDAELERLRGLVRRYSADHDAEQIGGCFCLTCLEAAAALAAAPQSPQEPTR